MNNDIVNTSPLRDESQLTADRIHLLHAKHPGWYAFAKAIEAEVRSRPDALSILRRLEPHFDAIICYASTQGEHEPNRIVADARRLLSSPDVLSPSQPIASDVVAREDFDKMSSDLTRAKNLLVRLWDKHPDARAQIEGSTGNWFVWGTDRG